MNYRVFYIGTRGSTTAGMRIPNTSPTNDIFYCPNACGKMYKHKSSLSKHLKYECGRSKLFKCQLCPKHFAQKHHLKAHLGLIHRVIV